MVCTLEFDERLQIQISARLSVPDSAPIFKQPPQNYSFITLESFYEDSTKSIESSLQDSNKNVESSQKDSIKSTESSEEDSRIIFEYLEKPI